MSCRLTRSARPKARLHKAVLETIEATVEDIPNHRLHSPDAEIWVQAGVLAGLLFRLSNLPKGQGTSAAS